MDAERLERAARALLAYFDQDGECKPHFYGGTIDALRAALAAPEPAPATGAVADAAIKAKAQGFDRICLRCLCGFSRTDECPRCQPTGSAQAGDAVAWQIVDHNYGPTHYFGMTEDDAWARMVKASGEGRSVWARTRFARPLYAAPAPAQADPWAWAVLLPGNTPQQARIRMTEREAMSCAAELPGFVIVPLYAAPSRPGGAARAAALEEAAKVCEGEERRLESHGDGSGDAEECARLIRALAGRGA